MTEMLRTAEGRNAPPTASVHEQLRERHPELPVQRLRRSTLVALSWAIEDEFCTRATDAVLVGAFRTARLFEQARERWDHLADSASETFVLAAFDDPADTLPTPGHGPARRVHLGRDHPMRDEWAVVCDAADMPVVISAHEVPGQRDQPEGDRLHDVVWSIEPHAVRTAARAALRAAAEQGSPDAAPVLYRLADEPRPTVADPVATSHMFARLIAYVDRFGRA